jgi:beta-N-acetylhexosaminidase
VGRTAGCRGPGRPRETRLSDRAGASSAHTGRAAGKDGRSVYHARRVPGSVRLLLALAVVAGAGTIVTLRLLESSSPAATVACKPVKVLGSWPLAKLADQTIVVPAEETDVSALAPAARIGYGGAILFGSIAPADLGRQLRQLRADLPPQTGWLVMTDEEGGGIQRMANLVGSMPWASQMGATMTVAQIRALARRVGLKMSANGVDMDLAPVLDVDGRAVEPGVEDPDGFRSFSGSTKTVEADGVAFLQGLMAGHVVPVVKHFPGLGGVSRNTDDGPATTLPWSRLQTTAIPPFVAAIGAGVPAMMVSNAIVPGLTGDLPASLSPTAVTRELFGHLHFRGLIITDSLSAKAISDAPLSLTVPKASVEAIAAGDDMVLFNSTGTTSGDLALAAGVSHAIVAAVSSGALARGRLIAAAAKVLSAKQINVCSA